MPGYSTKAHHNLWSVKMFLFSSGETADEQIIEHFFEWSWMAYVEIIAVIKIVLAILFYYFVPESFYYLEATHQYRRAREALAEMSRSNGNKAFFEDMMYYRRN